MKRRISLQEAADEIIKRHNLNIKRPSTIKAIQRNASFKTMM